MDKLISMAEEQLEYAKTKRKELSDLLEEYDYPEDIKSYTIQMFDNAIYNYKNLATTLFTTKVNDGEMSISNPIVVYK